MNKNFISLVVIRSVFCLGAAEWFGYTRLFGNLPENINHHHHYIYIVANVGYDIGNYLALITSGLNFVPLYERKQESNMRAQGGCSLTYSARTPPVRANQKKQIWGRPKDQSKAEFFLHVLTKLKLRKNNFLKKYFWLGDFFVKGPSAHFFCTTLLEI